MNIKTLLASVAIAASAVSASAAPAPTAIATTSSFADGIHGYFNSALSNIHFVANEYFVETITFSGLGQGLYDISGSFTASGINFSSISLDGKAWTSFNVGQNAVGALFSYVDTAPHTLVFSGKAFSSAAKFNGEVTVSAVPEPESYALMLAGIGLVGTIVRRRSKKIAS